MSRVLLSLILVLTLAASTLAGDEPKPTRSEQRVSIDATDRGLREVIAEILEGVKTPVIISPKVKGKVTVKLQDVPWREALEQVAALKGFVVVEEDFGIRRVLPFAETQVETDYYRFRNLRSGADQDARSSEAAAAALARLLRPSGELTYAPEENAIVFRGRKPHLQALKQLLVVLDRRTAPQDASIDDTPDVQRYEEMLRDSKTEAAAQYFVRRLGQLREEAAARVR